MFNPNMISLLWLCCLGNYCSKKFVGLAKTDAYSVSAGAPRAVNGTGEYFLVGSLPSYTFCGL